MHKVQDTDAKIVTVLHDVLEDTPTSAEDLLALGFSTNIVNAVLAVTKKDGENRFQAVQRTVKNPISCTVKLADLSDNMDLSRLATISVKDLARLRQYTNVKDILLSAQSIHKHIDCLDINQNYPKFDYQNAVQNFQYLLNVMFDYQHKIGGVNIGSPQEWWILFEDASAYFAYCKRKGFSPLKSVYLRLVNETDLNYFSGVFQDDTSQKLLQDMFKSFLQFHFKKDSE